MIRNRDQDQGKIQNFAYSLINAGDIDQDGIEDFLVGASGSGDSNQDAVCLIYGGYTGNSIDINFGYQRFAITPSSAGTIIKSNAGSDGF